MNKFISSIFILIIIIFNVKDNHSQNNQEWKWLNPYPQGFTLNWVKAFSGTNWIAAGDNGTFIRTSNAGGTWDVFTNAGGTVNEFGRGNTLYSGWFFNANTGFVCGEGKWLGRTTNGGTTWDSIATPGISSADLNKMYFINNNTGFIAGLNIVLKTTNGGLNWSDIPGVPYTLRGIYALDENNIFVNGNEYFFKSTNGGTNWIPAINGLYYSTDIFFVNSNSGFIAGNNGAVAVTTNGGSNWSIKYTGMSTSVKALRYGYLPYGNTLEEKFDNTVFPPAGWRAVSVKGPNAVWAISSTQFHSPSYSALIPFDCNFSTGGGLDWLITPGLNIHAQDTLSFWMRLLTSGSNDSLCVRVSITDTALSNFTSRVLYLTDGLNYPPENTWVNYKVSLNQFAGQNIYIGFKHQNLCGDGIFLDDVSIISQNTQTLKVYAIGDKQYIFSTTNMGNNWTTMNVLESPTQYSLSWESIEISGLTWLITGS